MQIINLYRYTRPDGGITVSTIQPDVEYTALYRLVADEGMALTDGTTTTSCVDTANMSTWSEIVDTQNENIQNNAEITADILAKAKAYDEALERMKSWVRGEHPECFTEAQKTAEFIFPELCESKDERIRKELIEFVKSRGGFKQEYIAWLETDNNLWGDKHRLTCRWRNQNSLQTLLGFKRTKIGNHDSIVVTQPFSKFCHKGIHPDLCLARIGIASASQFCNKFLVIHYIIYMYWNKRELTGMYQAISP